MPPRSSKKKKLLLGRLLLLLSVPVLAVAGVAFFLFYDVGSLLGLSSYPLLKPADGAKTLSPAQIPADDAASALNHPLVKQVLVQSGVTQALQERLPAGMQLPPEAEAQLETLNMAELTRNVAKQYGVEAVIPHLEKTLQPDQLTRLLLFGQNDELKQFKYVDNATQLELTALTTGDQAEPFKLSFKKLPDGSLEFVTLVLPPSWGGTPTLPKELATVLR